MNIYISSSKIVVIVVNLREFWNRYRLTGQPSRLSDASKKKLDRLSRRDEGKGIQNKKVVMKVYQYHLAC